MATPRVRRGLWSQEEDDKLRHLVEENKLRNWLMISKSIPGRTVKSCKLRWVTCLSKAAKNRPFSEKEDNMIVRLHGEFGNKWTKIARLLKGRTNTAVKNHWNSTLKRTLGERVASNFEATTGEYLDPLVKSQSLSSISNSDANSMIDVPKVGTFREEDPPTPTSLRLSVPGGADFNPLFNPFIMQRVKDIITVEVRRYRDRRVDRPVKSRSLSADSNNDAISTSTVQQVGTLRGGAEVNPYIMEIVKDIITLIDMTKAGTLPEEKPLTPGGADVNRFIRQIVKEIITAEVRRDRDERLTSY